jgi:methyl-accepting chemotaxis protein
LNHQARDPWLALRSLVEGMIADEIKQGSTLASFAQTSYRKSIETTIWLLSLSLLLAVVIAVAISKGTTFATEKIVERLEELTHHELTSMKHAVQALASGDITVKIDTRSHVLEVNGKNEFARLAASVNHISDIVEDTAKNFHESQEALIEMLSQTRDAAENIATSSGELASSSQDLSIRTTQQASSLETTASSMEEITSIIKNSTENASSANGIAGRAKIVAQNGGVVVANAVKSMQAVNESSTKIADIISVIDEIAFQTNLLALNAAVEAARVGEQGKGFAVVASEVRNLASRSSKAAKEIKHLVNDTVRKVDEGSKQIEQSGVQLKEIVSAVDKVASMVDKISSSSQEQSLRIEQVNKAVIQMDDITQQNAAMVEEAAASSKAMSNQAQELKSLVERFILSSHGEEPGHPSDNAAQTDYKATGTYGGRNWNARNRSSSDTKEF